MSSGGSGGSGGHWVAIGGVVAVIGAFIALGVFLVGDKLLCNLKGVNVGFLKCDNESDSKAATETPPLPPKIPPAPETVKQEPTPSSSPTSTSSHTPETPPPVSPSPTPVKVSTGENLCTVEQNGSTVNLGSLERSCPFAGNVSSNNLEKRYRFKIDNPSNISIFLDGVNSEVEISLYSDKDGTGVMGYTLENTSAVKSRTGIIKRELGVGSYIVVVKFKARDTPYSLQIINHTSQIKNIGYLEEKTISNNGSISLNNREQFYRFQLANPGSISLSLGGVNSEVGMSLYSDKDGTGVMGYTLEDISAFQLKPGIIKKQLGVGNYIVVVRLKAKETNYNLTMSAP
jgi:LEA14-like dessication related protein